MCRICARSEGLLRRMQKGLVLLLFGKKTEAIAEPGAARPGAQKMKQDARL